MIASDPVKLLTIAGSDSGGAAGLQADLKTFTVLGAYGMSAITAVTAQNSHQVTAVQMMTPDLLAAQLDAVLSDYGATVVKTGFIGCVELIEVIASKIRQYPIPWVVVDPVLVNHKGMAMFPPEVTNAYRQHLLPIATIITPNKYEAALLANSSLPEEISLQWSTRIATRLQSLGPHFVLVKGAYEGNDLIDILCGGNQSITYRSLKLATNNTHGSGDTLSAAIAVFLGQGDEIKTAVQKAHQFTAMAIQKASHWQLGRGHGPLAHLCENLDTD